VKGFKGFLGGALAVIAGALQGAQGAGIALPHIVTAIAGPLFAVGAGLGIIGVRAKQERTAPKQ